MKKASDTGRRCSPTGISDLAAVGLGGSHSLRDGISCEITQCLRGLGRSWSVRYFIPPHARDPRASVHISHLLRIALRPSSPSATLLRCLTRSLPRAW